MNISGTNLDHARSFNRRLILETARLKGPLSRADIARETRLSPQAISIIVKELEGMGLLLSHGRRKSARGQPPVDLAINPDGAYAIGLSIDNSRLSAVIANLAGDILVDYDGTSAGPDPATMTRQAETVLADLLRRAALPHERLWGLGIAMPGPFNVDSPIAAPTPLSGQSDVLAQHLGNAFRIPAIVENDATAAAIGERLYGSARALRDFAYIYFGDGLGLGLVLDGQPYRGHWGNAGEFGHLPILPDARACWCGNHGCLEQLVSLQAARETVAENQDPSTVSLDHLARLYAEGHPALRHWLSTAAIALRRAIAIVENLFDPQTIVIGGRLPETMTADLLRAVEPLSPSVSSRRHRSVPRLVQATAGDRSPALGAAALPIFEGLMPLYKLVLRETPNLDPVEHPSA